MSGNKYKNKKILVVEDNAVNQLVVQEMLKSFGAEADFANDGNEALHMASKGYDLIFMDLQMPIKDGFESTKELKNQLKENCPPIIAMTANVFQEDKDKCIAAGMIDFLPKPVNKTNLEKKIKQYLFPNEENSAA